MGLLDPIQSQTLEPPVATAYTCGYYGNFGISNSNFAHANQN